MTSPSPAMRNLARQLLAAIHSKAAGSSQSPPVHDAVAVCETLRSAVTKFAGPEGFTALLRRALALARGEAPVLQQVRLGANGKLEGLEEIPAGEAGGEAAIVLAAHVLSLLVTFIGEPLTLRFVREGWPDAQIDL